MAEILGLQDCCNADNTLDYAYLRQLNLQELNIWVRDNHLDLQRLTMDRVNAILASDPVLLNNAKDNTFLSVVLPYVQTKDLSKARLQPYIHLVTLCGVAGQEMSCHKVYYGVDKPVVLRGQTLGAVDCFNDVSAATKQAVIKYLRSEPLHTNNPVYIMYRRYKEIAYSEGYPVSIWIADKSHHTGFFKTTVAFDDKVILPHDKNIRRDSVLNSSSSLWWMALIVCPLYDLSLDYLFVEDYSAMAVREDRELTELEKEFLSAYLCAKPEAQQLALHMLGFELVNC